MKTRCKYSLKWTCVVAYLIVGDCKQEIAICKEKSQTSSFIFLLKQIRRRVRRISRQLFGHARCVPFITLPMDSKEPLRYGHRREKAFGCIQSLLEHQRQRLLNLHELLVKITCKPRWYIARFLIPISGGHFKCYLRIG